MTTVKNVFGRIFWLAYYLLLFLITAISRVHLHRGRGGGQGFMTSVIPQMNMNTKSKYKFSPGIPGFTLVHSIYLVSCFQFKFCYNHSVIRNLELLGPLLIKKKLITLLTTQPFIYLNIFKTIYFCCLGSIPLLEVVI